MASIDILVLVMMYVFILVLSFLSYGLRSPYPAVFGIILSLAFIAFTITNYTTVTVQTAWSESLGAFQYATISLQPFLLIFIGLIIMSGYVGFKIAR